MKKRSYDVADKTHGIALCVWGVETFQIGKCYYLTNVSVRQFGGETSISTTAQSKVTLLDVDMEVHGVANNLKVFEGQLITAEVKVEYLCPKQHVLLNVNLDTAITRCQQCGAYCKTAAVAALLRTRVTIEDLTGKMTEFVLRQLLNLGTERFFETDLLVSKLLAEDRIQLTGRGNRITAAAFLPPSNLSTNEMDRATDSGPTASCSTTVLPPSNLSTNEMDQATDSDDLMLEEFFRSEIGEELDSVNQKETEEVEVDGKGNITDCKRKEECVEGTLEEKVKVTACPKPGKFDRTLKYPGKTGKK
ncbi:uncharacterized protein LOC113049998 [Carassius auratus]|uniref:Uncharacterized protein LOC113049998 n=1 Tax=Carassius auratus TaxID=7957 RepID=A0A6P6K9E1_CARAU|nr:uncharacterized protein LOC113049998 [Carassius auratus]